MMDLQWRLKFENERIYFKRNVGLHVSHDRAKYNDPPNYLIRIDLHE